MKQVLTCIECGLDMVEECQCFSSALLDCTTKIEDLMKIVARSDIIKKLDA